MAQPYGCQAQISLQGVWITRSYDTISAVLWGYEGSTRCRSGGAASEARIRGQICRTKDSAARLCKIPAPAKARFAAIAPKNIWMGRWKITSPNAALSVV